MKLRSAVLSLATAAFAVSALAAAPSNDFTLLGRDGKPVGKASFSIDKAKNGFKVRSRFEYRLAAGVTTSDEPVDNGLDPTRNGGVMRPTEAQFNFDYSTDANGNFVSGYMRDSDTQMMTSIQPNKTRDSVTIGQVQAGTQIGTHTVPLPKPDFIIAPDFDPSAIQVLLNTSLAHAHADNTYLLVIPSSPDQGPRSNNNADYVILQPAADAQGTLDGKSITLKHYLMNFHVGKADIYTDADGNLMEAALDPLHITYVRAKFALAQ